MSRGASSVAVRHRDALVHRSAFVIRPGGQIPLDNSFSFDLPRPRHHGDVIVGSDETTLGIQAEARTELAFYPEPSPLQLCDREDRFAQVLGRSVFETAGFPNGTNGQSFQEGSADMKLSSADVCRES